MIRVRRIATAACLALTLMVGQQAVALHALDHALERVEAHDVNGGSPESRCEDHFLFTTSAGCVGEAHVPLLARPGFTPSSVLLTQAPRGDVRLAFLSRAPPAPRGTSSQA